MNVGRGTLRKHLPKGVWCFHHENGRGERTTKSTSYRDKGGAFEWADDRIEPALKE